jgi:hypothetical protein
MQVGDVLAQIAEGNESSARFIPHSAMLVGGKTDSPATFYQVAILYDSLSVLAVRDSRDMVAWR